MGSLVLVVLPALLRVLVDQRLRIEDVAHRTLVFDPDSWLPWGARSGRPIDLISGEADHHRLSRQFVGLLDTTGDGLLLAGELVMCWSRLVLVPPCAKGVLR